ncbi:hypothetical protein HAX54_001797, partial [Datura stramonium]|nr:hypothetical protein [Datura stramonium]
GLFTEQTARSHGRFTATELAGRNASLRVTNLLHPTIPRSLFIITYSLSASYCLKNCIVDTTTYFEIPIEFLQIPIALIRMNDTQTAR